MGQCCFVKYMKAAIIDSKENRLRGAECFVVTTPSNTMRGVLKEETTSTHYVFQPTPPVTLSGVFRWACVVHYS